MTWAAAHLHDVVLTWWDRNGADDADGGVWSCFDNRGRRLSTEKYTWSQGRWAWLCAELAREADTGRLVLDAERWRRRSVQTASFLRAHAVRPDRRTVFRTDSVGAPLSDPGADPASSVFADLFAALGLAGAAELAPDEGFGELAAEILLAADGMITAGAAPMEPYPVPTGFADLASSMSLLHTGAELSRLTGRPEGRAVARTAAERLGSQHLRHHDWWEYAPSRAADADTLLARHRTPGHLLECLWMLVHASDTDPDATSPGVPDTGPGDLSADRLADVALHALAVGWDEDHGGIFRYVDEDGGRPRGRLLPADRYQSLVADTWDTKLWWVHVEALYATALLARRATVAGPELWVWHRRIRDWTLATFPSPDAEWVQIRDREGRPLDRVVALPVKDPFHIARALLLLNRLDLTDPRPEIPDEETP